MGIDTWNVAINSGIFQMENITLLIRVVNLPPVHTLAMQTLPIHGLFNITDSSVVR